MDTILVAGGSGFIGSAFVKKALSRGFKVINYDALKYAGRGKNLCEEEKDSDYRFVKGDLNDCDLFSKTLLEHRPDFVINMAAESHVDRSISGPSNFIHTNILGVFNVLECVKNYWDSTGQPESFRFLQVSTDEVCGSLEFGGAFDENTPYDPSSPYSASKAAGDHLVQAWHRTYGLPTIISNCSNNYGPRQFPEKLIPVVITSALQNKPIPIYGTGDNVRDWIYVDDHVEGLFACLKNAQPGSKYFFGGGNEISNKELVCILLDILNSVSPQKHKYRDLLVHVDDRLGHDFRYAVNFKKATADLGWMPVSDFNEAMQKTVTWYLDNRHWWRPLLDFRDVLK